MVNAIRTIYSSGLKKEFNLRFCVGSWVQHETPEESWRIHQPKYCEYNNKDEDYSPNTLNDKNDQVSSQKFRKIIIISQSFPILHE